MSGDHSGPGGGPKVGWPREAELSQMLEQGEDRPTRKAARPQVGRVLVSVAQGYHAGTDFFLCLPSA